MSRIGSRILTALGYGPKPVVNPPHFPYTLKTNPYRCKRTWPPDFSQLSHKHQFRLERRYRMRTQLKWARPKWNKAVTIVMWGSITWVAIYCVLFVDVNEHGQIDSRSRAGYGTNPKPPNVFDPIRDWYDEQVAALFGSRERSQPQEKEVNG